MADVMALVRPMLDNDPDLEVGHIGSITDERCQELAQADFCKALGIMQEEYPILVRMSCGIAIGCLTLWPLVAGVAQPWDNTDGVAFMLTLHFVICLACATWPVLKVCCCCWNVAEQPEEPVHVTISRKLLQLSVVAWFFVAIVIVNVWDESELANRDRLKWLLLFYLACPTVICGPPLVGGTALLALIRLKLISLPGNKGITLIHDLPRIPYNPERFDDSGERGSFPTTCAICFEDFDDSQRITLTPCRQPHAFHTHCLAQWLRRKTECPICRTELSGRPEPAAGSVREAADGEETGIELTTMVTPASGEVSDEPTRAQMDDPQAAEKAAIAIQRVFRGHAVRQRSFITPSARSSSSASAGAPRSGDTQAACACQCGDSAAARLGTQTVTSEGADPDPSDPSAAAPYTIEVASFSTAPGSRPFHSRFRLPFC